MPRSSRHDLALSAALTLLASAAFAQPGRNIEALANRNEYPPVPGSPFGAGYAACWAYVHGDGREYAVIGTTHGTAIYNVSDPASPYRVAFIAGPTSPWREFKSYREWIYVVTEGPGSPSPGIQIVRMSDPETPVLAGTYITGFQTSHTVSVDTSRALLICNGTREWFGASGYARGVRILSIADPEAPVEISWWPGGTLPVGVPDYVHDSVPVGGRLYAASVYVGVVRVIDVSDPSTPVEISSWTYPGAFFTHNVWPDASGDFLYVTDEQNGQTLRVFDISNLAAPELVHEYTPNPYAMVHNAHVLGDELYLASYTEGVRVLDLADPAHPAEFAWLDTYPGTSGGYFGVWEVCPYFPSGTVIASDMQTGLHVFRPLRDYGSLRVEVVDAATSLPIPEVRVRLATQGDSLTTAADGVVRFAPSPGTHTVEVRHFGYGPASATRVVSAGSRDTVRLSLVGKPTGSLSGAVFDAASSSPLLDAEVILAYTPLGLHTDSLGRYALSGVPDDLYQVEVRRPGYAPLVYQRRIGPISGGQQDFHLNSAREWDDLELDRGWIVGAAGDDAVRGVWTRVEPLGTGTAPASATWHRSLEAGGPRPRVEPLHEEEPPGSAVHEQAQPDEDRTPGPGSLCFVTGQGVIQSRPDSGDVDGGRTSLTTPALDLTGLGEPAIGYWRWFYSNGDRDDWLAVLISGDDGATWVAVDTTRGRRHHWEEQVVRVADHVAPTTQVRLRFVAADLGAPSVVEAAIDDLIVYDASLPPVAVGAARTPSRLAFRAPWPNPASGAVRLAIELPREADLEVEILDVTGRRVRTLYRGRSPAGLLPLIWDGAGESGGLDPSGLYFARARAGGESASARFAFVR